MCIRDRTEGTSKNGSVPVYRALHSAIFPSIVRLGSYPCSRMSLTASDEIVNSFSATRPPFALLRGYSAPSVAGRMALRERASRIMA